MQYCTVGFKFVVASGAGDGAQFSDAVWQEAGASIVSQDDAFQADIILKVCVRPRFILGVFFLFLSSGASLLCFLYVSLDMITGFNHFAST